MDFKKNVIKKLVVKLCPILLLAGFIEVAWGTSNPHPFPVGPDKMDHHATGGTEVVYKPHPVMPPPARQLSSIGDRYKSFLYIDIGSKFLPSDDYKYVATSVDLHYGGHVSPHSFFSLGPKLTDATVSLSLKYGYDFIGFHNRWSPGFDGAILVGNKKHKLAQKPDRQEGETDKDYNKRVLVAKESLSSSLALGMELAGYIRANMSSAHSVFVRVGAFYQKSLSSEDEFDLSDLEMVIQLGLMWHF